MACTARGEKELKAKAKATLKTATDPLEILRAACLARGASGIKGLARQFKIMDDDADRQISIDEFKKGVHDFGAAVPKDKVVDLFNSLDKDGSGSLNFDEFLEALRPPMSQARKDVIMEAFQKIDKDGSGTLTIDDLRGIYNVKFHPKYQNGEMTEDDILGEFLNSFDSDNKDGNVTKEEFTNYYSGVSASIDKDCYFTLMMKQAWKLDAQPKKKRFS